MSLLNEHTLNNQLAFLGVGMERAALTRQALVYVDPYPAYRMVRGTFEAFSQPVFQPLKTAPTVLSQGGASLAGDFALAALANFNNEMGNND